MIQGLKYKRLIIIIYTLTSSFLHLWIILYNYDETFSREKMLEGW